MVIAANSVCSLSFCVALLPPLFLFRLARAAPTARHQPIIGQAKSMRRDPLGSPCVLLRGSDASLCLAPSLPFSSHDILFCLLRALGGLGGGDGFSPSSSSNAKRAERRVAEETAAPSTGEGMQMQKTIERKKLFVPTQSCENANANKQH